MIDKMIQFLYFLEYLFEEVKSKFIIPEVKPEEEVKEEIREEEPVKGDLYYIFEEKTE